MENSVESWSWNSEESSSISLHDSNDSQPLLIGGQATRPALRMCQGCSHYGDRHFCMVNCAEYQNMIGKAYQKP